MTLTEQKDLVEQCSEESCVKACPGVLEVFRSAAQQERVLNGVYKCAAILERDPDAVMLCILPQPPEDADVTINIEQTLIEAHCWENGIRVMKVDCAKKLEMLILDHTQPTDHSLNSDFSCVLVLFPKNDAIDSPAAEKEWKLIDNFFKKMLMHGVPHWHVIELPG
ncbi:growth arrest and DNA damage-inducible protein GADD45 beta-like isoform X1 [Saccostrea cucullata]|uniref:growth arrest and DNA damage-inducible protein GADD45 beta-like isoform X1 n=1 Tax=Saccostrea cuccullata TaxID=36930 RepID=UPI002ED3FA2E